MVKQAVVRVSTIAKILICLVFFGSIVLVVRIYNFCHIVHTTIGNLRVVFVKYFMMLMGFFYNCFFNNFKKCFPTFMFRFLLKGGLYHIMFLERFFLLLDDIDSSGQYLMFLLNPQSCKMKL